ncbi:MAG TPA: pitrilysin family protein, partial [Planctomycetota bacterium]|nr:pitrilysin family protein [Planctomycetota bacterium]
MLDNGMVVIVAPDPHAELVAVHLAYAVGSRDENVGATGLAHLFEHMMFNGATRYGPKQFDAVLERAGGYGNAFTRHDLTAYYTAVPPTSLATVLDLEADRMVGLSLDEAMLERERQVVLQERRGSLENHPGALLQSLLYASLFQTHPNRWPVLGWVADIEAASVATCRAFYERHYAPNRAVLVLAGAVEPEAAVALVERWFGGIPPRPEPRAGIAPEPARTFASHVVLVREAPAPQLM